MRLLIDATAVPADRGGVGRYVDDLIPALVEVGVEVHVVCQDHDQAHYGELSRRDPVPAGARAVHPAARLAWEQVGLPRVVSRVRPAVLHSPHYTRPRLARVPTVVTLHDATFFTDPQLHSRVKGPFFRAATRGALRHAACCVVPSQATADELARVLPTRPGRVRVAHHGVDLAVFHPPAPAEVAELRQRLGLAPEREFIAFLGTLEPRKNVPALIAGWAQAVVGLPDAPALVLAGGIGWDTTIDEAVASLDPRLTLLRPGYLPLEHLRALLGGALLVCYPSLFEGFGLPVLEAMACGAAVLTTRRGPLPEVGGDAVAYTEPDAEAIAIALRQLLGDADLRRDLGQRGVDRAAGFSWLNSAHAHVSAYDYAVGSRS